MLSEGVDAAPCGYNKRVEEFLASSGSSQPYLSDEKQYGENNSIGNECPTHNVMRQTLPSVVAEAEP
jgi:hypothetical protein